MQSHRRLLRSCFQQDNREHRNCIRWCNCPRHPHDLHARPPINPVSNHDHRHSQYYYLILWFLFDYNLLSVLDVNATGMGLVFALTL